MDIAATSMLLAQNNLDQFVGIRVFEIAKNQAVQQGQDLVQMMERSIQPNIGGRLDIKI
jgi:hypothetical protein